ncbi:MAG TPA: nicotinamide riboside transporter PnuC, partial [Dysgonomonas sp.]|nr:nicotinamide riboside transporter PnuC [Dysgonomonas sp.]
MEYIGKHWIEIIGAVVGLLYLYYEYRADILMWATGIVMSLFYTVVYVQATFYAFACINIYYIIVGVYGWFQWKTSKGNKPENTASDLIHTPRKFYLPIIVAIGVVFVLLVFLLGKFTDSQVVYADSFVTALSIVAMVMLAKKYVEQW